jgi:SAM-dependent methyltransferase
MTERALSFGAVAANYERYRLGYRPDVFDLVQSYAGRPIETALEIGAGTGKATRVFADRGIAITATEPDPDMSAELRKQVPIDVTIVQSGFEELRDDKRYGLVYSAAALHWTKPEGRWSKIAGLLTPGGVFANLGGNVEIYDQGLRERVRAARAPIIDDPAIVAPDETPPQAQLNWPGSELSESELFTDVEQHEQLDYDVMSAEDYVGMLSTVSAFLMLTPEELSHAVELMLEVLPAEVELELTSYVHLARRSADR